MKKYIAIVVLFLCALPGMAQTEADHEVQADSKIDAVTVFLNQAQITRQSSVRLKKGRNVVYFRGLASGISPQSIQVKAPREILINTVVHEVNYLNVAKVKPREQALLDSLKMLDGLIQEETTLQGILETERKMLLANQNLASQKQGLDLAQLRQAADFFRKRIGEITQERLQSQRKVKAYKQEKKKIKRQQNQLNVTRNRPSNDIRVVLSTYSAKTIPVELKYVVSNARWVPRYDLRAKDASSPIDLEYKADVYQNTGVDWDQVKLTLSTGNPSLGGEQPELEAWNLYVYEPPTYQTISATAKRKSKKSMAADEAYFEDEESDDDYGGEVETLSIEPGAPPTTLADYTEVVQGATTAEFQISVRQDVPTGNRAEQVTVAQEELPASYRYFSVPKLDKDAFLVAEVTEWEQLNLLAGKLNIFFEGTFVTESYLDPSLTRDTLRFSLGRDQRIVIEREQLKEFCESKTLGTQREKTYAYEIRIRNTKSEAVTLRLEDQLPISQDKNITVKIEEVSGASRNSDTGKLEWDLALKPGESRSYQLKYSVKWPKSKVIPGL